jgi:site-specific recombinase XerD
VHDLRHTAASIWLGCGVDPKVVQAILGHAVASTTMDLYGHLVAENLWSATKKVSQLGDMPGTPTATAEGE